MKIQELIVDVKQLTDSAEYYDSVPVLIRMKSWQVRQLLLDAANHSTHAAINTEDFCFRVPAKLKKKVYRCPECNSEALLPVLYGLVEEDSPSFPASDEHKKLNAEDGKKVWLLGCDCSDGYSFRCVWCDHKWKVSSGYSWGETAQRHNEKMQRKRNLKGGKNNAK